MLELVEERMARQDTRVRAPTISFIVRVWPGASDDGGIRGEVEHIGTGERRLFLSATALTALLESWRHDIEAAS